MSINGVVQIFIKRDVAAAMAPAAHVDGPFLVIDANTNQSKYRSALLN